MDSATTAELLSAVSALRRALRRSVGRAGGVADLSEAQRELVRVVRRRPGIRVGEAAADLHVAANTVSTLVSGLCSLGWLHRGTDPDDGRSARLYLTPDAEERVAQWRDRRLAVLNLALRKLAPEDQMRVEQALPALRRIVELVEERV